MGEKGRWHVCQASEEMDTCPQFRLLHLLYQGTSCICLRCLLPESCLGCPLITPCYSHFLHTPHQIRDHPEPSTWQAPNKYSLRKGRHHRGEHSQDRTSVLEKGILPPKPLPHLHQCRNLKSWWRWRGGLIYIRESVTSQPFPGRCQPSLPRPTQILRGLQGECVPLLLGNFE